MRVLHVMECTIGGTRRHLRDLALGQAGAGVDVAVVVSTLRDPGFPADLEWMRAAGVDVHILDMVRSPRPWTDLRHGRQLGRLMRDLGPDIVHTHSSKAGVLGRQASLRTGIGRRVHTPHTFAFLFEALFSPLKRRLYRAVESHFASSTDRFVAVAPSEAETWMEAPFIPSERVRVVRNGIDPEPWRTADPLDLAAEFELDPDRPVAVVVGLVYAAKGQDLALEALARPGVEDLQLLIVGPGDLHPTQELARRLGLTERVRFTGPRDDVPRLLAGADLLVLPSRWEGMPYVVLEAFAAGCPVVAHPVDGARDAVQDGVTGWLARGIGAEPLHEALARFHAADPSDVERVTSGARRLQAEEYSVDSMVADTLAVYEELL